MLVNGLYAHCYVWFCSLNWNLFPGPPTDSQLNLDSFLIQLKTVEDDWRQLGECLGVSPPILEEIASHCSTAAESMVEMADYWLRKHRGQPTWSEVATALQLMHHCHLADAISAVYSTGRYSYVLAKFWFLLWNERNLLLPKNSQMRGLVNVTPCLSPNVPMLFNIETPKNTVHTFLSLSARDLCPDRENQLDSADTYR